jgi:hypothetical protein
VGRPAASDAGSRYARAPLRSRRNGARLPSNIRRFDVLSSRITYSAQLRTAAGFSGIAKPLLDTPNCQKLPPLVPPEERPDHQFVQVEVRFRPPQVFAALSFFQAAITGLPGEQVRSEEFDRVNIDVISHPATLEMDPPDGWRVTFSHKTNVLLGVP